jgi:hypothetical protein
MLDEALRLHQGVDRRVAPTRRGVRRPGVDLVVTAARASRLGRRREPHRREDERGGGEEPAEGCARRGHRRPPPRSGVRGIGRAVRAAGPARTARGQLLPPPAKRAGCRTRGRGRLGVRPVRGWQVGQRPLGPVRLYQRAMKTVGIAVTTATSQNGIVMEPDHPIDGGWERSIVGTSIQRAVDRLCRTSPVG